MSSPTNPGDPQQGINPVDPAQQGLNPVDPPQQGINPVNPPQQGLSPVGGAATKSRAPMAIGIGVLIVAVIAVIAAVLH